MFVKADQVNMEPEITFKMIIKMYTDVKSWSIIRLYYEKFRYWVDAISKIKVEVFYFVSKGRILKKCCAQCSYIIRKLNS